MVTRDYETIRVADAWHALFLDDCHDCDADANPKSPSRPAFTYIAPVQRICARSSNSLCLCIEYTFGVPWVRMCYACAAILNSHHRRIIAAQAAANRAALLQRVRSDHKILFPKTAFTPTIMPCHNRYEPMRAVRNRCTGTTHSGPGSADSRIIITVIISIAIMAPMRAVQNRCTGTTHSAPG